MPIDATIPLQVKQPEFQDPTNALMRVLQIQGLQGARQKEQRALDQQDALNSAYGGALGPDGKIDENKLYSLLSGKGQGSQIPGVQKSLADVAKTRSETSKNDASAFSSNTEGENKTIAVYRDASQSITDPQSAIAFVTHMHSDPRLANSAIARIPLEQALSQIPQDPNQLGAWKQQFALGATKFMELNKPTTNVVNTGGQTQMVQTPGLGGAPTVAQTFTNTVSPDAQLSSDTSVKTTGMNNATSVKTTGMNNATSTANNRATIAAENVRSGINADGTPTGDMETTAQAIAKGQLPPPSGMALTNPRNQRILARVMEINPQYDYTTVTAKKAAATAFTSGNQGNALRAVSTANAHLDQLGELVDALGNGNTQIINRVANAYATQTGNPAPTNFDAIKNVIGQEVVKAVVAGGGSAGERDEAARAFSNAASPAQLKGAISHYRMVMQAQQQNLLEQRRAAGLPDTTLPSYNGGAPSAPAGWSVIGVHK